jgi:hypothetical protein
MGQHTKRGSFICFVQHLAVRESSSAAAAAAEAAAAVLVHSTGVLLDTLQ